MQVPAATNQTLGTFLTPVSFLFATDHWVVVLRPQQATLGATILIAKHDVTSMADLPADAVADLHNAWQKIATMYDATLQPEKINYLALMMVDPNPHFHVLPRYAAPRAFDGAFYDDPVWPKPPSLGHAIDLTDTQRETLAGLLRSAVA